MVARFYEPILIVAALNEESRRASAAYAIQVFQEAMLSNQRGYVMGLPACPLSRLYAKAPCRDLRANEPPRCGALFRRAAGDAASSFRTEQIFHAGSVAVIFATTNHHAVQRWVPQELARGDERFAGLEKLESVPILGAHLWFDRPVMEQSHAALLEGPLQWLFRKDAQGHAVHGVIKRGTFMGQ